MASATLITDSSTLAPTSESRQNYINRPSSFTATNDTYTNGSYYDEQDSPHLNRQNMSFSMSQSARDGMLTSSGSSFRQYDNNGVNRSDSAPQIYSAVYSGVDVYEMEVQGIAVMRRRKDSWLNATQILKVAGIEKGKRTKVLEKEILVGEHEKVQGGYGKYQGTWIKFQRGLEFCRQYGVEDVLRPLLTYDMGQDGSVAGQGNIETPTKEQAMAAQRKRMYNSGMDNRNNGTGAQSGTFFKNISSTASHAVAAISKARFDSPAPRMRNGSISARPPSFSRRSSQHQLSQEFPGGSQQSMQSIASADSFNLNGQDSAYATQSGGQHYSQEQDNGDIEEPPRKRMRPSSSMVDTQQSMNGGYYDMSMRDGTPTEPNDSFVYQTQTYQQGDESPNPVLPLPMPTSSAASAKKALLMSLFTDPSRVSFSSHDAFRNLSPHDLDMPIDNTAHTALHWAATLARLPLLKTLISHGAGIFRVNRGGETALMRACAVTNNLDMGSFPDLLELLGPSIELRDSRGRTVLHHIAITSAVKGRSQASKYYLESLLEFVVRQGSAPNSQQSFTNGPAPRTIGIGRFMSEVVNVQDKSGDTALNIASRIGNRSIISQLLEVGADASIPNRSNLCPIDFGIGDPADAPDRTHGVFESPQKPGKGARESSGEIISSITTLLLQSESEFTQELSSKQSTIDSIHKKLRESSAILGEERRRLETITQLTKDREERKLKIANLRRAADEETQRLNQMLQRYGGSQQMSMQIGDADIPFALPAANINPSHHNLDPATHQLLSTLPSTSILRSRLNAYKSNNEQLEIGTQSLKRKSTELASKYRKIVSLCTRVEEHRVDGVLEGLVRAVESEREDVELGRVREFLKRVEGGE